METLERETPKRLPILTHRAMKRPVKLKQVIHTLVSEVFFFTFDIKLPLRNERHT